jgi:peptidoglycan hydrolase-like protein with peptidoglycan-binding domain
VGVESEDVRVLQEYLRYISQYYSEIPPLNPTGYFGYQTENAVKAAQTLFGLEPNGIVGPVTWLEIARLYSDLYNGTRLNEGQYPGFAPQ